MLMTSFRRSSRSRLLRALLLIFAVFFTIDLLSLISTRDRNNSADKKPPNVQGQRIFIASIHWNNEQILRSRWNRAILELVEYFGPDQIYVSIHESGSWDNSKDALRELDRDLESLRVRRTITLEETTHKDEIQKPFADGWIDTPRGKKELRRIPYLSKLRNKVLKPLNDLALEDVKFDKVLFLNDVAFQVCYLLRLLSLGANVTHSRLKMLRNYSQQETVNMRQRALWTSPNPPITTILSHYETVRAMKL